MTARAETTSDLSLLKRASGITLGAGMALSLLVHLSVGVGASGYFSSAWGSDTTDASAPDLPADQRVIAQRQDDEKITLGREDARSASIHWLGVRAEDKLVGDAPEAEVEQAQFTTQQGNASDTAAPETSPAPGTPEPAQAPLQTPRQAAAQTPVEAEAQPEPQPHTEPPSQPETQPQTQPAETEPEQSRPALNQLPPAQAESDEPVLELQDEPVEQPVNEDEEREAQREGTPPPPEPEPIPEPEPVRPQEIMGPAPAPATDAQPPAGVTGKTGVTRSPTVAGKEGVLSERESTASILKRAVKVDAEDLNKPIAGKGLEIITVEPRFPASVRFTTLPKNPVLLIRFDAQGRVRKVSFLRDGLKVFDTGAPEVDQPLINAVYQWRAKGREVDQMDPRDKEATIEISMRVLFRKESESP